MCQNSAQNNPDIKTRILKNGIKEVIIVTLNEVKQNVLSMKIYEISAE